jgi:RNA polymerase sigma-70 factor (ECF subfamily)
VSRDGSSTASTGELGRAHAGAQNELGSDRVGGLYAQQFMSLRRFACSLCRSWADAGDIVQDVFTTLAADPDILEAQLNPVAFLFRAVRNRALNFGREERTLKRELALYVRHERAAKPVASNDGEAALLSDEVGVWIETLIPTLTPIQREVFTLVRLYGLQQTEAAKVLGVSVSTIKSHVRRATRRLARGMRALGLADGRDIVWARPTRRYRRDRN